MGDLAAGCNSDLNRLADIRASGGRLDALDEQRLRDHQLRRLRRLWLKDQILSIREPLVPPKKLSWLGSLRAKEATFWSKQLKFQRLVDYLHHGKDYHEVPKLWLFQSQRLVRRFIFGLAVPFFPVYYLVKYGGWDMPGLSVFQDPQIFPGEKYETVRRGDIKFDRKTLKYIPVEHPDEWQYQLK